MCLRCPNGEIASWRAVYAHPDKLDVEILSCLARRDLLDSSLAHLLTDAQRQQIADLDRLIDADRERIVAALTPSNSWGLIVNVREGTAKRWWWWLDGPRLAPVAEAQEQHA